MEATEDALRVAAVGDVHAADFARARLETCFDDVDACADLLLLAGDLTAVGTPEEAAILAEACAAVHVPVVAVLGNHDHHCGRADEVAAVLAQAGVRVLDRDWTAVDVAGRRVGIVGLKGFVGGFHGSHLPDFGERLLRELYAETTLDVEALDTGLGAVGDCDERIVLLHYSPTRETLDGEPEGIHAFLGNDRLAEPIARRRPSLVLHGHAHAGSFAGAIDGVPVLNVAQPLLARPYAVVELGARAAARSGR